ncbi:metal ABC transporter permease [Maridesulfovibrio sp.]|uniref:metal ABC transporter permease n=1 Tax=Maridesulfovibrio sp. TaxID=2795000 RepID=UPI003B002704
MESIYDLIRSPLMEMGKSGTLPDYFQYAFVINALICSLLAGPILGGIGTMVVAKRLAFFSQAVGQAALTGVALGIILGEPYTAPYVSLFGFCILFGLLMNYTRNRTRMSSDTVIGVFLSISLAVGACVLLYVTGKVNMHVLDNILFGSILTVNNTDINVLAVICLLCVAVCLPMFNKILLASFNPSLAHVRGINVKLVDYIFILIITVITVAALKIVGAVLVEALFIIPAAAARNISRSMRGFFFYSMLFATLSCLLGVVIPMQYQIPVPSGGAIIIVAAFFFAVTSLLRTVLPSFREAAI